MLNAIKNFLRRLAGPLSKEEVVWVVNDLGELGVRIGGTSYFLYKGDSIIYNSAHEDSSCMMQRPVMKREFGEVCRVPGLSRGDDGAPNYFEGTGWFPLTGGNKPILPTNLEEQLSAFLDSNTIICPYCTHKIRATDLEAHETYGCNSL